MFKITVSIVFAIILSGCGQVITSNEFNDAYLRCKDHGGISHINRDLYSLHAICTDNTRQLHLGKPKDAS